MSAALSNPGREALDFIDSVKTIRDCDELMRQFEAYIGGYGYFAWLVTGIPPQGEKIDPLIILNGWDSDWYDLYRKSGFVDDDPCVARVRQTTRSFFWSDIELDPRRQSKAARVMNAAGEFRMTEGFCMPLHGDDGFEAVVTMAGSKPDISAKARSCLGLVSIFVHSQANRLRRPQSNKRVLSVREREVLTWLATGRSAEAIAAGLGITADSVEVYLRRAAAKLATRGRVRTLVEAFQRGEIQLP
jgi:LuxR family transcriptional regulator, quorum-sensing system regulator BjaR1